VGDTPGGRARTVRDAPGLRHPGVRLVHTFTLAQDAEHPSEVAVEFLPAEADGSTVRFAHGGWTESNAAARRKFGDWKVMLDRFVALAEIRLIGGQRRAWAGSRRRSC
jgi:hypothetical protein